MGSLAPSWLGKPGFRRREPSGGSVVFVDPFLSSHPIRTWEAPISPQELGCQVDVILCTHQHRDQFERPALKTAAAAPGAGFTLVVPQPIVDVAVDLGIPREPVIGAQPRESLEVATVNVHPVPARHGVAVSDAYTFDELLSDGLLHYQGSVVEMSGARAYHAGDCIPYDDQAEIVGGLHPQLALLPIIARDFCREGERNIVGNVDFREAARLTADLGAQALIPMHSEMLPHNRRFPGDLVASVAEFHPHMTMLTFGRSGRFAYKADEEA